MKALDGPFMGKEYLGVSNETKQIIEYYYDEYVDADNPQWEPIHKVIYNRTENGWVEEK